MLIKKYIFISNRRFIGIRKKDSIGHRHHPKMMQGLAGTMSSMSNYSYDSPRYVDTHRGSVLEEVDESTSDSEEEDSSEEETSSSEEQEEVTRKEDRTDQHDAGGRK